MKRTALYIRVSSEEQAIHGLSIEAQLEALDAWAKQHAVTVIGRYIDAGISARKKATKRPQLQNLLTDVQAGKIDLIIFTKLDRWFRNIAEYYKVQEILEANGVNWKTIQEDYDTSTASGRLKVNIMLSVAQDEADRTGERIKAVFDSKIQRSEPISGKVPLGYKIEGKKIVVDEENAAKAKDIFEKYIALRSIRALRSYVMTTYGLVYCHTGLKSLLQNERYIGKAHGQNNFCPPIIDTEMFRRVQDILQIRAERHVQTRSERVYLFTGIAFCAECGNRLSAHVVAQKYIYYRCTKYEKVHLCTHKKRTSELALEDWLLKNITTKVAEYNASLAAKDKTMLKPDTTKIKTKMEKLKDLYLNDLIDLDIYKRDYASLKEELETITASYQPSKKPIDLTYIKNTLAIYSTLSRAGKKEFWSRIIGRIDITDNDEFFVTPISP